MSSSIVPPPPVPPGPGDAGASESPHDPDAGALWGDSDVPSRPPEVDRQAASAGDDDKSLPTIGHIGRYALKTKLGVGGLGTVYAAHDPLLSRLIAVKTLNLEVPESERDAFNAVFINEARAAGGLSHPHIVTVFDAGISDKRAYIAMELLKGRDLRKLRQEGWRATPAQAALIARRVADALAFAHSKGVIHRDIKPANIFMVGRTQPRVLDFGIARVAHQRDSADLHSGAGSPYYIAPEQIRREPADRRADVFSLGVVLYELLTDVRPFRGETLKEIVTAVLTLEPPLASTIDPAVPRDLALIVARAMAKDPEQRFRSARSLARELRQWLDANPIGPDGEGIALPAVERPRRRAAWLLATAGVLAVSGSIAWRLAEPTRPAGSTTAVNVAASPGPVVAVSRPEPAAPAPLAKNVATQTDVAAGASRVTLPDVAADAKTQLAASTDIESPAAAAPALTSTTGAASPTPGTALNPATAATRDASTPARNVAKDLRTREANERVARERAMRAAALAAGLPVAALSVGTVKIAVSPWGEIEVDGNAAGAAPPLTELKLAEGRHQIVVRNGDFAPYTASVAVTAGQVVSVQHKFGS